MLSTAQALKEWENVLKLLADIKANAAANPHQKKTPSSLTVPLQNCFDALDRILASPVATWRELMRKEVSTPAPAWVLAKQY